MILYCIHHYHHRHHLLLLLLLNIYTSSFIYLFILLSSSSQTILTLTFPRRSFPQQRGDHFNTTVDTPAERSQAHQEDSRSSASSHQKRALHHSSRHSRNIQGASESFPQQETSTFQQPETSTMQQRAHNRRIKKELIDSSAENSWSLHQRALHHHQRT